MSGSRILVVDDEPAIRQIISSLLNDAGYLVDEAENGTKAIEKLNHGDIDIALCDIKMPDINGIDLLRKAKTRGIDTAFIMMTAFASINIAIEAMKAGANDFIIKPLKEEDVLLRIAQLDGNIRLRNENRALRRILLRDHNNFCQLPSQAFKEVERLISKVAQTDNTILITGESGTGKGVVAKTVHQQSLRQNAPFIPVNCGAIPENLIESELFGHVKGSFTGAYKMKNGLFFEAKNGTIFLDEIGELPLHLQVKLLHVIEAKNIRPVGSDRMRPVDVRIIAASNQNLDPMVNEGKFREDLYFRLNVFQIHIPPLRGRKNDISVLIKFFLANEVKKLSATRSFTMDPEVEEMLLNYGWPGNIRELENVITRAVTLAEDMRITIADLPTKVTKINPSTLISNDTPSDSMKNLRDQVRVYEYNVIRRTIDDAKGNRQLASHRLGIGLSTLYRKLEEYEK